jgi:hypothetical protein
MATILVTLFAVLFTLSYVFLFGVLLALLRGYVLSHLWGWFLVPLGAPPIGMVCAIGISIILSFLVVQPDLSQKDEDGKVKPVETILVTFLVPLMVLLVGYVVHRFI